MAPDPFALQTLIPLLTLYPARTSVKSIPSTLLYSDLRFPEIALILPRDCRIPRTRVRSGFRLHEIASDALGLVPAISSSNTSPQPNRAFCLHEGYNDFLRFPGREASSEGLYRVRRHHNSLTRFLIAVYCC